MTVLLLWMMMFSGPQTAAHSGSAEDLYRKGMTAFSENKVQEARLAFQKTLAILKEKSQKATSSRTRALLELGQSDLLFHLSLLDLQEGKKQTGCLTLEKMLKMVGALPHGWESWPVNPQLQIRFRRAKKKFLQCQRVPSYLFFSLHPKETKVFFEKKTGVWEQLTTNPSPILKRKVTLQFRLNGYQTVIKKDFFVPRWQKTTIKVTLSGLVALTSPKPLSEQKLWYRSPWLWIGVGGVLATAGIVSVIALTRQKPRERVQVVLASPER